MRIVICDCRFVSCVVEGRFVGFIYINHNIMETNEEYHDPDYPEKPACVKEEEICFPQEDKVEKIKQIIRLEFSKELEARENEVNLIDQKMTKARRYLHLIRYNLVNNYYSNQKLQLSSSQIEDDVAIQSEPRARAEVASILRESQPRIHPSVLKLIGKQTVNINEIFQSRGPRNKIRKDYSAMVQSKNYTISADATTSLRPDSKHQEPIMTPKEPSTSKPRKMPRHIEPKVEKVLTLDESTRNKMKHRYRIIIGNTSKYAPAASRLDRSTHKWLLYVRGSRVAPDISRVVTAVTVRLHASYAPHHTVKLDKPPFHISRRGWGEFPAKVELHFPQPEMNRPAVVEHTIKLDRNFTGLQTLGSETIVDVWLYSTPEMLEFEYKEDNEPETQPELETPEIKEEPQSEPETLDTCLVNDKQTDSRLDFFSKDTELNVDEMLVKNNKVSEVTEEELKINTIDTEIKKEIIDIPNTEEEVTNGEEDWCNNVTEDPKELKQEVPTEMLATPCKKRIMKYIDPTTGKIYYLEMDRNLDLSKVQEIVINSKGNTKTAKISPIKSNGLKNFRKKKPGVSLLKPEVQNSLKNENINNLHHIQNDHCYLGVKWLSEFNLPKRHIEQTSVCDNLKKDISKLTSVRVIVNYLLKKIPLISDRAKDIDFVKNFPFVVESAEKYWKLDFAKRRNIEWSRAKFINKILVEKFNSDVSKVWRTKQILIYSRLHGFHPIRMEQVIQRSGVENNDWSIWNDLDSSRNVHSNIKEIYPQASDITTLSIFDQNEFISKDDEDIVDVTDSDEEIDVISDKVKVKKTVLPHSDLSLKMLPVENEEDRLRFMFIEKKCADIGIDLRIEDIGEGYSYSAVHAVLLSAMKCFAEELIRSALAEKLGEEKDSQTTVWTGWGARGAGLSLAHVLAAASRAPRLRALTGRGLAAAPAQAHAL